MKPVSLTLRTTALVLSGLAAACSAQSNQSGANQSGASPSVTRPSTLAAAVRAAAIPISDQPRSLDPLIRRAGQASFVLLGEASHGTHEFYRTRAAITQRLITEHGFDAVVVEGDWPETQRVNRFIRVQGADRTPEQALSGFQRFPTWMWRNTVVRDFVGWLRTTNATRKNGSKVGFYGMDLYSLAGSRQEVIKALTTLDPPLAARTRTRYACLAAIDPSMQDTSAPAAVGGPEACERNVTAAFDDVRRLTAERRRQSGAATEALFDLEQNARVVKNAVAYERTAMDMFSGASSWNVRDQHMFETLQAIRSHLGADARIVVWAHNSHLGDARATEMGRRGELNVGQLIRQRYGPAALLVGFTTHTGTVTAATEWDAPGREMQVRPSLEGSYERLFHDTGIPNFLLDLSRGPQGLQQERLERAIGVQYLPASERSSHYFQTSLPRQFDMVLHFDITRALQPLAPAPR